MNNSVFYAIVAAVFVAVVAVSVHFLSWFGLMLDCYLAIFLYDGATHYASQDDSQTGDE